MQDLREASSRGTSRLAAAILAAGAFGVMSAMGGGALSAVSRSSGLAYAATGTPAPDAGDDEEKEVPPSQVDRYITVYKAMQRDHSVTVEQAAAKQGMTVEAFRKLEDKIERDDAVRERVRKALKEAAEGLPSPSATGPK